MTKEEILSFLSNRKQEFKKIFDIDQIGLYGSYARDDQTADSDIDIVYTLKDKNRFGYFEYLGLMEMLSRHFQKRVELVNYKYMNPIIKFHAEKEIIYA